MPRRVHLKRRLVLLLAPPLSALQLLEYSAATSDIYTSSMGTHGVQFSSRTLSNDTRSEACSNVRLEISSTIRVTVASFDVWAGGGGCVELAAVSVVVAKYLDVVAILEQLLAAGK